MESTDVADLARLYELRMQAARDNNREVASELKLLVHLRLAKAPFFLQLPAEDAQGPTAAVASAAPQVSSG